MNILIKLLYQLLSLMMVLFLVQSFFIQPFKIPSSSMKPGLQISDYLIVCKFYYGYNNNSFSFKLNTRHFFNKNFFNIYPERGDIIVFTLPNNRKSYYIKRILGMPGETLQVKGGVLYINKFPISRKIKNINHYFGDTGTIYKENLLNGKSYFVNLKKYTQSYVTSFDICNTPTYNIPDNHFFVMGDNRNNSTDSRNLNVVGYISKENIVGRAKLIFWANDLTLVKSLNGISICRFFRSID